MKTHCLSDHRLFIRTGAGSEHFAPRPNQPFRRQDVGAPGHRAALQQCRWHHFHNGGGDDIWNTADNFFYYYTSVTGLVGKQKMRVVSFTGPDYWSKIELMARRPIRGWHASRP